jgi:hypothetical protein
VQQGAVVGGEAGAHAVADEAVILGAALGLGVVVDAVGVGQQAQSAHAPGGAVEGGEGLAEPAQRPRGGAAEDHTLAPGLRQNVIKSVGAPDAEHADDVAAANVDHVLCQQVCGDVLLDAAGALIAAKQRYVACLAFRGEATVEAHHVVVRVARCGGKEADARAFGRGQGQYVVIEQRAVLLHREAAASEGKDLTG